MIQGTRIRNLNDQPHREHAAYVLYWMQEAQRPRNNAALEMAIGEANRYKLPVVVCFGLTDQYPEANLRHYSFMLEGLAECATVLKTRGIKFVIRSGHPVEIALALATNAAVVICDRSYMPAQIGWRMSLADKTDCQVIQVETETVVPVEVTTQKLEYAARTIRPKLRRVWDEYLVAFEENDPKIDATKLKLEQEIDLTNSQKTLGLLNLDRSVGPVKRFCGGQTEARRLLGLFTEQTLAGYATGRNEPAAARTSFLSPYLHFGQISPVEMALAARKARNAADEDRNSFVEELVVRRELAINYVFRQPNFATYGALPNWARQTLADHAKDPRSYVYDMATLERYSTHDQHWNDAMREMVHTGFMHNYMRMYWAKKILEWTPNPQKAFAITLALNNKYLLDGRDPNSYANVAWCYGLHDRAWSERPIFGKIRYMNANGLNRKFDMAAYTRYVDELVATERY